MSLTVRAAAALLVAAALAACSGSIGNGGSSALPGGLATLAPVSPAPGASGTPSSATGSLSIGTSTAPQPLPTIAGYSGTVAFTVAQPAPSASGTPSPAPSTSPSPVSATVFTAVVRPSHAPEMQERQKHGIALRRQSSPVPRTVVHTPLLYVTIDPTRDVHLATTPIFVFDVPEGKLDAKTEFGLAFYDPTEKAGRFHLDVAERDLSTPPPEPSPSPAPAAKNVRSKPSPLPSGASPAPAPVARVTKRVAFTAGSGPVVLKANKSYVFALYGFIPTPPPSPSPSPSPGATGAASPAASSAGSPSPASPRVASPAPTSST